MLKELCRFIKNYIASKKKLKEYIKPDVLPDINRFKKYRKPYNSKRN